MARFTPAPGCSQSSREIFPLSHSPPPPCCLWHRSHPALQPGAAHKAKFGQLEHPTPSLKSTSRELGRAAGCSRAPLFLFAAEHSQILGKSRIWGCPRRAVLLCQPLHSDREEKQECGGFLSTSSLGDWIQQLLSINSPRIPNYLLLPA